MSQPVLALGTAAVTAAGSVWYLPALADLRAGDDRPASRRTGAVACLSGWSTAAAVAVLLLLSDGWWPPCAAALAGATATAGLWARAAVHRRRGTREAARLWAQLGWSGPPGRSRGASVVVALVLTGSLLAATAAATAAVVGVLRDHGRDPVPLGTAAAVPLTLVALALAAAVAVALTAARRARHREYGAPARTVR
ncbi:hypothetical protein [Streptomyces prasinopilosus]|uniref:Uncharacterized protein n=1 Tax=Streptomyces prasinopilosus TaxID=67344 RepID=A0A1G6XB29_9ACTN|nr:hypothetical protein [Streptomyces prasinopilosus]SDD75291.1 hypothetical protein SAMN05216505_111150 [Streptomyces prasinopilosus]